jgi:hypothetical protein
MADADAAAAAVPVAEPLAVLVGAAPAALEGSKAGEEERRPEGEEDEEVAEDEEDDEEAAEEERDERPDPGLPEPAGKEEWASEPRRPDHREVRSPVDLGECVRGARLGPLAI